jgi:hypothetical protein
MQRKSPLLSVLQFLCRNLADRVETLLSGGDEVLRELLGWQFGL